MSKLSHTKDTYLSFLKQTTQQHNTIHIIRHEERVISPPHTNLLNAEQQKDYTTKPAPLSPPQQEYSNTSHYTYPSSTSTPNQTTMQEILNPYFFLNLLNPFAQCPPASDPLRRSATVLVPPGCGNHPLSGSDGYHIVVVPPPPSIASDTTSASPRDPASAGRWPGPHTQDTKSGTTLGNKVNPRSTSMVYYESPFLRRMYHTSAHGIPCEQGNNALHQDSDWLDDMDADGVGAGCSSDYFPVCGYVCCS